MVHMGRTYLPRKESWVWQEKSLGFGTRWGTRRGQTLVCTIFEPEQPPWAEMPFSWQNRPHRLGFQASISRS